MSHTIISPRTTQKAGAGWDNLEQIAPRTALVTVFGQPFAEVSAAANCLGRLTILRTPASLARATARPGMRRHEREKEHQLTHRPFPKLAAANEAVVDRRQVLTRAPRRLARNREVWPCSHAASFLFGASSFQACRTESP